MGELRALLQARATELAAERSGLDEFDVTSSARVVRRKRTVRAVFTATASVLGVAAIGGATFALSDGLREPAHVVTTPSSSTSIAPSPSVSDALHLDADGRALPGFVTQGDDLPTAKPTSEGTLAAATAGWALGTYRPSVETYSGHEDAAVSAQYQVVYLADPEGTRYQLLELPPEPLVLLAAWDAGSTTATIVQCEGEGMCEQGGTPATLDLLTGHIETIPDAPATLFPVTTFANGASAWMAEGNSLWVEKDGVFEPSPEAWKPAAFMGNKGLSPDDTRLALVSFDEFENYSLVIFDSTTWSYEVVQRPAGAYSCTPEAWMGDTVGMTCVDAIGPRAYIWDPSKADPVPSDGIGWSTAAADKPLIEQACTTANGSRFGAYWDPSNDQPGPDPLGWDDGAKISPLTVALPDGTPAAIAYAAECRGDTLYVTSLATPTELTGMWNLSSLDTTTNLTHQLFPAPAGGAAGSTPAAEGVNPVGLSSWVIGR